MGYPLIYWIEMFNQEEYWSNRKQGKRGQTNTKLKKNMVVQAKPEHTI